MNNWQWEEQDYAQRFAAYVLMKHAGKIPQEQFTEEEVALFSSIIERHEGIDIDYELISLIAAKYGLRVS